MVVYFVSEHQAVELRSSFVKESKSKFPLKLFTTKISEIGVGIGVLVERKKHLPC